MSPGKRVRGLLTIAVGEALGCRAAAANAGTGGDVRHLERRRLEIPGALVPAGCDEFGQRRWYFGQPLEQLVGEMVDKGIRYEDEHVRKKAGKAAKAVATAPGVETVSELRSGDALIQPEFRSSGRTQTKVCVLLMYIKINQKH
mgnify:CR=1 FL=1